MCSDVENPTGCCWTLITGWMWIFFTMTVLHIFFSVSLGSSWYRSFIVNLKTVFCSHVLCLHSFNPIQLSDSTPQCFHAHTDNCRQLIRAVKILISLWPLAALPFFSFFPRLINQFIDSVSLRHHCFTSCCQMKATLFKFAFWKCFQAANCSRPARRSLQKRRLSFLLLL